MDVCLEFGVGVASAAFFVSRGIVTFPKSLMADRDRDLPICCVSSRLTTVLLDLSTI